MARDFWSYNERMETAIIELTEQQIGELDATVAEPPRLVNPHTQETFVLLRTAEYERLKRDYDDSPWTQEELQALAWERIKDEDWSEYDDFPDKT